MYTNPMLNRAFLAFCVCLTSSLTAISQQAQKVELRVALFPYIPDANGDKFGELTSRIKKEFETANPAVSLTLRPFDPNDDFYDLPTVEKWLGGSAIPGEAAGPQYDLVEVDTILLGELAATKKIATWAKDFPSSDWHPAAKSAVQIFGETYGIPHLLCGHFVFSTDKRITKARSISALIKDIKRSNVGGGRFAADILGSWNTPSLYLDGWQDSHRNAASSGLLEPLDETVVAKMRSLVGLCVEQNQNPCLTGAYNDNDVAATLLGEKKIAATIGYSERLHPILKTLKSPKELSVASAPLGEGSRPLLFTDALVRRSECSGECEKAAQAFAQYLTDPKTQEWIMMSKESQEGRVPRYLLPATLSAFEQLSVKQDPFYPQLRKLIQGGIPYPSFGLYRVRSLLRDAIMNRIKAGQGQ